MNFKFIPFLFFLLTWYSATAQRDNSWIFKNTTRETDSLELVRFYHQTRGELWKEKWDLTEPIDDWYGVILNENGRVFCIDMDGDPFCSPTKNGGNHLHGKLPDLTLPFLEHLFLSSNKISGKLPKFTDMPNLLTLQLSGNRFEGRIPPMGNLQKLVKLDLEYNNLKGPIPDFELKSLESLYLSKNNLSGELPAFEGATNLKHLYINDNQLEGPLPDFKLLRHLTQLILSHNFFTDELPDYSKLSQLNVLIANNNELEGCYLKSNYAHLRLFTVENNLLHVCQSSDFNLPDAFSPNGDGVNDTFNLTSISDFDFERANTGFRVWNSKKVLVYANDEFDGIWDGNPNMNGTYLPEGLYIYWLKSGINVANGTVYIKR